VVQIAADTEFVYSEDQSRKWREIYFLLHVVDSVVI
jgi:hypothetical protein